MGVGSGRGRILHLQLLVEKLIIKIHISRNTNYILVYLMLCNANTGKYYEGLKEITVNVMRDEGKC